jgi:hypothetical protein
MTLINQQVQANVCHSATDEPEMESSLHYMQLLLLVSCLEGTRYRELPLPEQRLWLEELQIGLGVWQGSYEGIEGLWLRWYDINGQWILTASERVEKESQLVEQERQRAEQERQRAERLAEYLRSQGIDPDNLP